MSSTIRENIEKIKANITESALKAGRNPSSISLMAVSKTKPLADAIEASLCDVLLGENYVQEFKEKFDASPLLPWHFIGHLQTNKVKYVVPRAIMIHSLDSLSLAEKINKEGEKHNKKVSCLIEINSGDELSKYGLTIKETPYIIKEMEQFQNISIRGLMTIPPFVDNPEKNREIFKRMNSCFEESKLICPTIDTLSMGMSNDYGVAVEEGATIVRVGTAIFGERNYNK